MDSFDSLSRFGVFTTRSPYGPISLTPRSSAMKRTIFGLAATPESARGIPDDTIGRSLAGTKEEWVKMIRKIGSNNRFDITYDDGLKIGRASCRERVES